VLIVVKYIVENETQAMKIFFLIISYRRLQREGRT